MFQIRYEQPIFRTWYTLLLKFMYELIIIFYTKIWISIK